MNLRLCPDDPAVAKLHNIFKANILRIPEERIVPLTLLASSGKTTRFLGQVETFVGKHGLATNASDFKTSVMASLTNRQSRVVGGDVGAEILSGLLQGMGGAPTPDVSVHFKGAKTLSFNFPSVLRRFIEIGRIGQLLAGLSFERDNLLFETLVDRKTIVHLVDSVITSNGFEIEAGSEDEVKLSIDVAGLQKALAGAKINVETNGAGHVSITSSRWLTFAFTIVNLKVSSEGKILAVAPNANKVAVPQLAGMANLDHGNASHVLLTRRPALVDLELEG